MYELQVMPREPLLRQQYIDMIVIAMDRSSVKVANEAWLSITSPFIGSRVL